ncbi:MAG: hypothetical protein KAT34_21515 [Candidatus Aminicenantes bacterium]|nr:hypothetical protein [Candidatus Aminicenantes bacterium]
MNRKFVLKQIFVLVVLCMLLASMGYGKASARDSEVIYDFAIGEFEKCSKFKVKYGRNVTFRVININPFLFKVEINGKTNDYFVDGGDSFLTPEPVTETKEEKEEVSSKEQAGVRDLAQPYDVHSDQKLKEIVESTFSTDASRERLSDCQLWYEKELKEAGNTFGKRLKKAREELKVVDFPNTKKFFDSEIKRIRAKLEEQLDIQEELEKLVGILKGESDNNARFTKLKKWLKETTAWEKSKTLKKWLGKELEKLFKEVEKKLLEEALQIGKGYLTGTEKFYTAFVMAITRGNKYREIEVNVNSLIKDFVSFLPEESRESQRKAVSKKCKYNLNKANSIYNAVFEKINAKNAKIILDLGEDINNFKKKNYEKLILDLLDKFREEYFSIAYTFPTVQNDDVEFTLNVTPLKKDYPPNFNKMPEPVTVKVYGGWKLSFSAGVLFGKNMHDHTYRVEDVEVEKGEEAKVQIKENEDKWSVTPVVMAIMHIHPRSIKGAHWGGFSFGLGTSNTEEFSYYAGTSWIFGSKKRFIINCGVMARKIDYLSSRYELGTPIDQAMEPSEEKLIERKFRLRLCLGITYNLK